MCLTFHSKCNQSNKIIKILNLRSILTLYIGWLAFNREHAIMSSNDDVALKKTSYPGIFKILLI